MYLEQAVVTHAHLLHWLLVDKFRGKAVRWLVDGSLCQGLVVDVLPDFDLKVLVDSPAQQSGEVVRVTVKNVLDRSS